MPTDLLLNTNEKWYVIVRKRRIATPWIVSLVATLQILVGGQLSTELLRGIVGWHGSVGGTTCWASPAREDPGFDGDGFDGGSGEAVAGEQEQGGVEEADAHGQAGRSSVARRSQPWSCCT